MQDRPEPHLHLWAFIPALSFFLDTLIFVFIFPDLLRSLLQSSRCMFFVTLSNDRVVPITTTLILESDVLDTEDIAGGIITESSRRGNDLSRSRSPRSGGSISLRFSTGCPPPRSADGDLKGRYKNYRN